VTELEESAREREREREKEMIEAVSGSGLEVAAPTRRSEVMRLNGEHLDESFAAGRPVHG
jgi:hypothetical protein